MYLVEEIKITAQTSVKEALQVIDTGAMKIALVVDAEDRLIGTLSDGDVRRALLKGLKLDDPIDGIYNAKPVVCRLNDPKDHIIQTAVARRVYQIPLIDDHGRVVKLAEIDHLIRKEKLPNSVVIMAGGKGKRLLPLTEKTPKPMLKVGGKPILEVLISRLQQQGFSDIHLSVNYKKEIIKEYFGDGRTMGVSISYIEEHKPLGTAGALSLMNCQTKHPILVMNGDILTNVNFENLVDFHVRHQAAGTMCIREYGLEVPYGVVRLNKENIVAIEEKPVQQFYVNAGIYVLNPDVVQSLQPEAKIDMTTIFENLVAADQQTISFPIREFWMDIGKMEDYNRANNEFYRVFND